VVTAGEFSNNEVGLRGALAGIRPGTGFIFRSDFFLAAWGGNAERIENNKRSEGKGREKVAGPVHEGVDIESDGSIVPAFSMCPELSAAARRRSEIGLTRTKGSKPEGGEAMAQEAKPRYFLAADGAFVIENYNRAKPFASFFPGIAGPGGIPMWTFYVNRAQCVCSMGIEDKEHPIMEFLSANRAYQLVSSQGFRTFVKLRRGNRTVIHEPFQQAGACGVRQGRQRMIIRPAGLVLEEECPALGMDFSVEYFNVPEEDYAGLIRVLRIRNRSRKVLELEILDGLPLIIPYGVDNKNLKNMRRLVESFVEVVHYPETRVPFFKGRVKQEDRPEVTRITEGNFYFGFCRGRLVNPIVDPEVIFGARQDYSYPERFAGCASYRVPSRQVLENRLPCAMGLVKMVLKPGQERLYYSVMGHASGIKDLERIVERVVDAEYIERQRRRNTAVVDQVSQNNFVHSSSRAFDLYCRQNFLDNVLRGGLPVSLRSGPHVTTIHLYSRKHGDLERDYNDFRLTPTPYSQGNGNYRDVNQNRRNDLFCNPDIGEDNVRHFYDLIQLDGYNPLVIKPTAFRVSEREQMGHLLRRVIPQKELPGIQSLVEKRFLPGELVEYIRSRRVRLRMPLEEFLGAVLGLCKKCQETDYGHGFWSDHWTYNLDLLENYLAVYPEELRRILLDERTFTFFNNPYRVLPRHDKYVIWEGRPMQLGAVVWDEEKANLVQRHPESPYEVRTQWGDGQIYRASLLNKLLCLIANKLATLDPFGVGVEMEADKPNWYDALNGLPGLLGSSLSETLELKRHILFLRESLDEIGVDDGEEHSIFVELKTFINELESLLAANLTRGAKGISDYEFWDRAATVREHYRDQTRLGVSGEEAQVRFGDIRRFLDRALRKLERGITRAWDKKRGLPYTYFINQVVEYEEIVQGGSDGETGPRAKRNPRGLVCFRAKKFRQVPLPLFLEGPVHYLRIERDQGKAAELARAVRRSGLFDRKLGMYKVNENLTGQPLEIGRTRTFSRGWLENESIWLHMEYKYLLELLRSGCHREFYRDMRKVLVPFMDASVYGRSILENSSFLASSANPDPAIHGNGFVARLSGSTAEFIHILLMMSIGPNPFSLDEKGELRLRFSPVLPGWLFSQKRGEVSLWRNGRTTIEQFPVGTYAFMFLGSVLVVYHNRRRADTFGAHAVRPQRMTIRTVSGEDVTVAGGEISGPLARRVRAREVERIDIELG